MSNRIGSPLSFLTLLLFSATAAFSQQGSPENTETLNREVLGVQTVRFQAMLDGDIETLESVLSDDLTYTHTSGWTETKAEFLSTLRTSTLKYESIQPREVQIRLLGGSAVVTGLSDMHVTGEEEEYVFTIRFIEVYHRTNGNWKLVAWQSTRLKE